MKLTYRKANVGDVPALDILMSELMSDLFGKNNRARMEQVVAEMQQDARYYLAVACEGEQVVGTAMGVLCHDLCGECRPFMVIENVIVSQVYRGKGVGRGLLQELERWGRAQGCTYIDLVSSAFRTQAHRFYEAMGYSSEGGFRKSL